MIVINSLKTWCERLPELLASGEECLALIIHPDTEIATGGWEDDVDTEYCETHNIPVYNQNRNGGTIVCCGGSIGLGFVYDNRKYKEFLFIRMALELKEYLRSKGLTVGFEHNDVLVDGYKVASGCGYNLPPDFHRTYEGLQISVNQDMETIRNVCKKPMEKVPKGLSDYGIGTKEMYEWCISWLRDNIGLEVET